MNSTLKKYFIFLLLIIGIVAVVEMNETKPINWSPNLSINSKDPFGLYILNKELPSLLKDNNIIRFKQTPYEFLEEIQLDTLTNSSFLFIDYSDNVGASALKNILQLIEQGNTVFWSNSRFNYALEDTLGFELNKIYGSITNNNTSVWTTNKNLSTSKFVLDQAFIQSYFYLPDSVRNSFEVLGLQNNYESDVPNFIKIKQGKGTLFLHSQPLAFSNYSLLNSNNHIYVENVLSYLPKGNIYWSVDKLENEVSQSSSILRFILTNEALKWAWYFFLIGLILFVFFTAKRKQRIIPIEIPIKNTTLEFTKTVSNLYIQSKDYEDIIQKRITYTLEKIRRIYYVDTHKLDQVFIENYQAKSGKKQEDIIHWVQLVTNFQANPTQANEEDLIAINRATEKILN